MLAHRVAVGHAGDIIGDLARLFLHSVLSIGHRRNLIIRRQQARLSHESIE
jgi:hypothetical protein